MLGIGHQNNTSLHLAEYRAQYPGKRAIPCAAPVLVESRRIWTEFQDIELDDTDFELISKQFAEETRVGHHGHVALAEAALLPQRLLVDYAVEWMEKNRFSNSQIPFKEVGQC